MEQDVVSGIKFEELIAKLKVRFIENVNRHKDIDWEKVLARLKADPRKLWSVNRMESTGG